MTDDPSAPRRTETRRATSSGAEIVVTGDVVVKVHHPRTDAADLTARLAAVVAMAGSDVWVQPLEATPRHLDDGRLATVWPRVDVLDPTGSDHPWAGAGRLLARLHRVDLPARPGAPDHLPQHGGTARLARALDRATGLDHPAAPMLVRLGTRLLDEVAAAAPPPRESVVHGDWHLGQLARTPSGLRLLDVDDLGRGDPTWDLARPAGFWAAGALDDGDWTALLDAYVAAGGPAVPVGPAGPEPWPGLDLPARCAVVVAAVRSLVVQPAHSEDPADALLEACARM